MVLRKKTNRSINCLKFYEYVSNISNSDSTAHTVSNNQDNELTKTEFLKLAHDHPSDALSKELKQSHVGGMSHFNCLYQMRLALISHLHQQLKQFKPPKVGNNGESDKENKDEVQLSDGVMSALCDNFDLVNDLIRTESSASSQILQILLDSIGRLDLNALANEPTVMPCVG